jgi:hypothetical protein
MAIDISEGNESVEQRGRTCVKRREKKRLSKVHTG